MRNTKAVQWLTILAVAILGIGLGAGCDNDFKGKNKAKVVETKTAAQTAPADTSGAAAAEDKTGEDKAGGEVKEIALNGENAKVEWVGAKVTGKHDGGFKKLDGVAIYEGGALKSATVTIDMSSIYSDNEKLTGHLQAPDFFDVATHPKGVFTLTGVKALEKPGEDGATHEITGDLELKGTKKTIAFPLKFEEKDGKHVYHAEFTIKRFDWKVEYKGKADDLINDEVLIKLHLELAPPA